jgi:hypothetical protein
VSLSIIHQTMLTEAFCTVLGVRIDVNAPGFLKGRPSFRPYVKILFRKRDFSKKPFSRKKVTYLEIQTSFELQKAQAGGGLMMGHPAVAHRQRRAAAERCCGRRPEARR